MKFYIIIIFIVIPLFSYTQSSNLIVSPLSIKQNIGPFLRTQVPAIPYQGDFSKILGIPRDIDTFLILKVSLHPAQDIYTKYTNGTYDKQEFDTRVKRFNLDTSKITPQLLKNQLLIFTGVKDTQRITIIDTNLNRDFDDDEIILGDKEVNSFYVISYECFDGKKLVPRNILLKPYLRNDNVKFRDELQNKLKVIASLYEHRVADFTINDSSYSLALMTDYPFSEDFRRVHITFRKKGEQFEKVHSNTNPSYQIGDIVVLDSNAVRIVKISPLGDSIFLKLEGQASQVIGHRVDDFIPNVRGKTVENKAYSTYNGKYTLYDFWGTWCKPCIQMMPEIKAIYDEYEKYGLEVIGVAYDKDVKEVQDFLVKENIEWTQIFENRGDKELQGITKQLRVSTFPTTILVGPDGTILKRVGPENLFLLKLELDKIFKN